MMHLIAPDPTTENIERLNRQQNYAKSRIGIGEWAAFIIVLMLFLLGCLGAFVQTREKEHMAWNRQHEQSQEQR